MVAQLAGGFNKELSDSLFAIQVIDCLKTIDRSGIDRRVEPKMGRWIKRVIDWDTLLAPMSCKLQQQSYNRS